MDSCTAVDDAVAIASLYRALVRHALRCRDPLASYCPVVRAVNEENRWRAQRYGVDGLYVDPVARTPQPFGRLLEDTLALVKDDIEELGLCSEIPQLKAILRRGTSAQQQIQLYGKLRQSGHGPKQACREVARWLLRCTEAGDFVQQPRNELSTVAAATAPA